LDADVGLKHASVGRCGTRQVERFDAVVFQRAAILGRSPRAIVFQGNCPLSRIAHLGQQIRNLVQVPGSAEQVHMRGLALDALMIALGHAADHANDHLGPLAFDAGDLAQSAVDLVLGVLADAARIEQHEVRLAEIVDREVPQLTELPENQLAVELVHLAAHRFQVNPLGHGVCQFGRLAIR